MPGRIRSVTGYRREQLFSGWELATAVPGRIGDPAASARLNWKAIERLGTAAEALRADRSWDLDGAPRRFDAEEWWYRLKFSPDPSAAIGARIVMGFDGLATLADAWLNGRPLLSSDNMFVAHEVEVDDLLTAQNELLLRFRSLDADLAARRPRPRWRAPMIEQQQLRWVRTTLLGRTPGWSAPVAAVGPWRAIWLERRQCVEIEDLALRTSLGDRDDRSAPSSAPTAGVATVSCNLRALDGMQLSAGEFSLERHGRSVSAPLSQDPDTGRWSACVRLENPDLWWPHTHGEPALYRAALRVDAAGPGATDPRHSIAVDLGSTGFRRLELHSEDGGFQISVNGVRIFCRGACWTPLDSVRLTADRGAYRTAIEQVRTAGMNMLRVCGTMVYEDDAFLDECDAQGVLLWQDFMFANMDYPEDEAFEAGVAREALQQLSRLAARPSLAVLCGNSEVEQQAAMWGAPRGRWSPRLFHRILPELAHRYCPGIPYWPSSAHGGAFPHQNDAGTTSYYGVGAYLRPLEDARRSELRFASECLAFANIPEDSCIARMPGGLGLKVHHPVWKLRTPRDLGAGWDFEDVRDFYLRLLFGAEPPALRYADHERYLELSRAVSGAVMAAAFGEWRRKRSPCNGALIWFLRDLWPGAGWGVVDAYGEPKAAYYALRRVLQPVAIFISDEGCNGLKLHIVNEPPANLQATLSLVLYRAGQAVAAKGVCPIEIAGRATVELDAASLFEGFQDLSYAYRFGPVPYDVAVATVVGAGDAPLAQAYHFPAGQGIAQQVDLGLSAMATPLPGGVFRLALQAQRFAHTVTVRAEGFDCEDQYFHLTPGSERVLTLKPVKSGQCLRGSVHALNAAAPVAIEVRG